MEVEILDSNQNFIHTHIEDKINEQAWFCTFVYANPNFSQRRHLWSRLLTLYTSLNAPWCLCGDFNEVLSQFEKDGIRPQQRIRLDLVRDFLDDAELVDLELKGNRFTWISNPRQGHYTRERLDRVLVNWGWRNLYPNAMGTALPIVNSDHAPVSLVLKPATRGNSLFMYEAYWDEHAECSEVIKRSWNLQSGSESPWENLQKKSNRCKRDLKKWSNKTFKRADSEIIRLKARLEQIHCSNPTSDEWEEARGIQKSIKELWR